MVGEYGDAQDLHLAARRVDGKGQRGSAGFSPTAWGRPPPGGLEEQGQTAPQQVAVELPSTTRVGRKRCPQLKGGFGRQRLVVLAVATVQTRTNLPADWGQAVTRPREFVAEEGVFALLRRASGSSRQLGFGSKTQTSATAPTANWPRSLPRMAAGSAVMRARAFGQLTPYSRWPISNVKGSRSSRPVALGLAAEG